MPSAPFEEKVFAKYGAPMGRKSDDPALLTGRVYLRRVSLYGGGCYDKGGAYWGQPSDLWCAWHVQPTSVPCAACKWSGPFAGCSYCKGTGKETADGQTVYVRAPSRAAAKAKLLSLAPSVNFYK